MQCLYHVYLGEFENGGATNYFQEGFVHYKDQNRSFKNEWESSGNFD